MKTSEILLLVDQTKNSPEAKQESVAKSLVLTSIDANDPVYPGEPAAEIFVFELAKIGHVLKLNLSGVEIGDTVQIIAGEGKNARGVVDQIDPMPLAGGATIVYFKDQRGIVRMASKKSMRKLLSHVD